MNSSNTIWMDSLQSEWLRMPCATSVPASENGIQRIGKNSSGGSAVWPAGAGAAGDAIPAAKATQTPVPGLPFPVAQMLLKLLRFMARFRVDRDILKEH
jgi:hypothetical protein